MESFRERCFVGAQIAAILYECGLTLMQVEQVLRAEGYSLHFIGLSWCLISDHPESREISEFALINGHVHAPKVAGEFEYAMREIRKIIQHGFLNYKKERDRAHEPA
jgi:hypothetical protein